MALYFFLEEVDYQIRDKKKLIHWLNQSAKAENRTITSLNVILCTDTYLHKINLQFLNHDTFTDVITFDYGTEQTISGEIFISLERVRDNAKAAKTTVKNELHRVLIHGLLHLCGYRDKSPTEKAQMTVKEDYYLSLRDF